MEQLTTADLRATRLYVEEGDTGHYLEDGTLEIIRTNGMRHRYVRELSVLRGPRFRWIATVRTDGVVVTA